MKVIVSVLLSLALFFTLAWWNRKVITSGSEELAQQASKIEEAINSENWELASVETEKIKKIWIRHKKTWLILLDHQDIDEIDLCIYKVDQTVKIQESTQALADIAELKFHVQDIADKERLELANIF